MTSVVLIVAMAILGSVVLLFVGVAAPRSSDQVLDRLADYGGRTLTLEEIELSQPFSQRIVKPLLQGMAQLLGRLAPQRNIEGFATNWNWPVGPTAGGRLSSWGSGDWLGFSWRQ